ncbi:NAD(P)-dependent oxidoreductase [Amycolatopsis sp. DG1A-15b]|jgi:3-hydroxyisobutyrate dehydrogenase-like beta-hydroxyacid dehydrogenase|uniref:NAD(P)-dependent oxidoreductase n=1 Tax=Amycolatopsis sp. DG1A-15b TaxID=3052846 RepID=UPI00255BF8BD|nr:NAD(P)-dependent oxidoreductase [Amycolatopsis sp. DG1A-15b]WIX92493.1 NAD(P)-dependent oxidoreductase [Amycolatopsis sp. DG1A-15b]
MKPVGFVGLGRMGAPMARRLLDWPGGLIVHDVRPEALEPFREAGARTADSPREVAATAEVISLMVRDDAQVEEVLSGPAGILETATSGTVVAIHSTIAAATATRLAETYRPRGIDIVDAPVSGGASGAAKGDLAVMVGAGEKAFERCRDVFAHWAGHTMHAGPPGAGTRAKLARNLLHFVSFAAAAEAQRLAEAAGLDLVELGKVVRHSDAVTGGPGAIMVRGTTARITPDEGWYPIFSHVRDLGHKDLALAIELGAELDVDTPLARLALDRLAAGLGVAPEGAA